MNPDGEIRFIAAILDNEKFCLSDIALTDLSSIFEDFFLCITSRGKIENTAVAPPKISIHEESQNENKVLS